MCYAGISELTPRKFRNMYGETDDDFRLIPRTKEGWKKMAANNWGWWILVPIIVYGATAFLDSAKGYQLKLQAERQEFINQEFKDCTVQESNHSDSTKKPWTYKYSCPNGVIKYL